jgi:hypothetical protein
MKLAISKRNIYTNLCTDTCIRITFRHIKHIRTHVKHYFVLNIAVCGEHQQICNITVHRSLGRICSPFCSQRVTEFVTRISVKECFMFHCDCAVICFHFPCWVQHLSSSLLAGDGRSVVVSPVLRSLPRRT